MSRNWKKKAPSSHACMHSYNTSIAHEIITHRQMSQTHLGYPGPEGLRPHVARNEGFQVQDPCNCGYRCRLLRMYAGVRVKQMTTSKPTHVAAVVIDPRFHQPSSAALIARRRLKRHQTAGPPCLFVVRWWLGVVDLEEWMDECKDID